jgi:indole-3-glycerol phosphate synthase
MAEKASSAGDFNVLERICNDKRAHVSRCKEALPLTELEGQLANLPPPRGFIQSIRRKVEAGEVALIAEIKKASPSKGIIREDFHPETIAEAYTKAGAACLSVLTDTPYFQGEDSYLARVRNVTPLPLLRKDFMIDPYQVTEARVLGADCILLILAALPDSLAQELEALAFSLGLDVLAEVHDQPELERALKYLKTPLLGVNNRNLKTLSVDLQTSLDLAPLYTPERIAVCESGIYSHPQVQEMQKAGYHTFLVGESLMRETDIEAATRKLLGK